MWAGVFHCRLPTGGALRETVLGRAGLASDAEVLDRVHRVLGPVDVADNQSLRATLGKVLKVVTRSGDSSFVKWYRDQTDYQREWDALTHYTPALGSDAPRLIDNDEGPEMLLISELQGEPAAGTVNEWDPLVHYKGGLSSGDRMNLRSLSCPINSRGNVLRALKRRQSHSSE